MKLKDILNELYSNEDLNNPNLESQRIEFQNKIDILTNLLLSKKKVLFLTCSNRTKIKGVVHETPKSTALAYSLQDKLKDIVDITIIDVPSLNIVPCEGNVSRYDGNSSGVEKAILKDPKKKHTGMHRS